MKGAKKINNSIQKLQKYYNASFPILSVYFDLKNTKTKTSLVDYFYILLNNTLPIWQQDMFNNEILSIVGYIQKIDTMVSWRNMALFSGGNKIWEVIPHDFAIPSQCHISNSPFLSPLLNAIKQRNRYLVILADREKAIYFSIYNGNVEAYEEFKDPIVPQKVKANNGEYYARSDIILRHIENQLHRHLKRISHHVDSFVKGKSIQTLVIGGHKELLHKIEKHLCPALQKKVAGEFITELNIPKNEIITHSNNAIVKLHHMA